MTNEEAYLLLNNLVNSGVLSERYKTAINIAVDLLNENYMLKILASMTDEQKEELIGGGHNDEQSE